MMKNRQFDSAAWGLTDINFLCFWKGSGVDVFRERLSFPLRNIRIIIRCGCLLFFSGVEAFRVETSSSFRHPCPYRLSTTITCIVYAVVEVDVRGTTLA